MNEPENWQHRLMIREMLYPTPFSDVLVRETIRPRFERMRRLMREICPEADDRRLNALVFSVIGQCLHYKMARRVTERLIGDEGYRATRPGLSYRPHHHVLPCRPGDGAYAQSSGGTSEQGRNVSSRS